MVVRSRKSFRTRTAHAPKSCAGIIFALFQNVGASMTESMQEMMEREKAEAIRTMKLANSALSRLFGIEEEEEDNE